MSGGLTQSKMKRGGTRQALLINKSTSHHEVVWELIFFTLPGRPSLLPQGTLPFLETLWKDGFGVLTGEQLPLFTMQPLQGREGSWHENLASMSAWASLWRKWEGLTPTSPLLCRPSLGPCLPDYMKETLAFLTWHTGKSRNSHKECQISSSSICSHLTNHNCVGKTERLCLSCSWCITHHQIMQPDSVIKRTQQSHQDMW